ncbi:hypothetical protein SAMN05192574_102895 [Mucilaginibacter gossypiicola]|uniref:Uncharacterized protein n=2 Tax=Mucilaginibacter gossypiicola TaxID=551995 RepID=A0A1H8EYS2_9SPHI|nr:hypothetical protein SAMN05192574_102895 [Mucilaginibacter gossypiicola]
MNAKGLNYKLFKSLSEMDLKNTQIDVSFMPLSSRYGSAIIENKVTKQVYYCKFVAIDSKYRITAVMTKGRSWFGPESHLMAVRMLAAPSSEVSVLKVVSN